MFRATQRSTPRSFTFPRRDQRMSLQLKQDHKFSADETKYLADRNRYAEIEENAKLSLPSVVSKSESDPEPEPVGQNKPVPPREPESGGCSWFAAMSHVQVFGRLTPMCRTPPAAPDHQGVRHAQGTPCLPCPAGGPSGTGQVSMAARRAKPRSERLSKSNRCRCRS
jgi:hypothetical protein